jgi:hypothetical protein
MCSILGGHSQLAGVDDFMFLANPGRMAKTSCKENSMLIFGNVKGKVKGWH